MVIRMLLFHIFQSIKNLKRNRWMTLSSLSSVAVSLILLATGFGIIINGIKLANQMEKNVDISVFVVKGTNTKDRIELEKKLKKIPHVDQVKFSSQHEELKKIELSYGESWKLFEQNNPLHDVYVVSVKSPKYIKSITKKILILKEYVEEARYGDNLSDKILKIASKIKILGLIGVIFLLLISIFLIANTIKITILSRQREIQIMRLVGATNNYIRFPFLLEGIWIGLLGSIVPITLLTLGYPKFFSIANPMIMSSNYFLVTPEEFVVPMNILLAGLGILIGSIGSIISVRRFLSF